MTLQKQIDKLNRECGVFLIFMLVVAIMLFAFIWDIDDRLAYLEKHKADRICVNETIRQEVVYQVDLSSPQFLIIKQDVDAYVANNTLYVIEYQTKEVCTTK